MVPDISHTVHDLAASELVEIGVFDPVQHVLHAVQQRGERFFLRSSAKESKRYILRNALQNVGVRGDSVRTDVFSALVQRRRVVPNHSVLDIVQIPH